MSGGSSSPELNPLFVRLGGGGGGILRSRSSRPVPEGVSSIPAIPTIPTIPTTFQRESTRLRSNVADQVQRDLLPAGRLLSVFLVVCELLAECAVLFATWNQVCDRPLRLWIFVLMSLQCANVFLHCFNIFDSSYSSRSTDNFFLSHRNGLSASDPDMYDGGSGTGNTSINVNVNISSDESTGNSIANGNGNSTTPNVHVSNVSNSANMESAVGGVFSRFPFLLGANAGRAAAERTNNNNSNRSSLSTAAQNASVHIEVDVDSGSFSSHIREGGRDGMDTITTGFLASNSDDTHTNARTHAHNHAHTHTHTQNERPSLSLGQPQFIDQYVRIVNALYLVWYIFGSIWVSGGGTCSSTAPHLYRLVVALTIIYYALLFLPLACFCLIVCCLPLFILVYRIMLPYAERERRRARAADPNFVSSLSSIPYSAATFSQQCGTHNLYAEDPSCVICLCDYEDDEQVLFLPCKHHFHLECISRWLQLDKACCLCKQDIDSQNNGNGNNGNNGGANSTSTSIRRSTANNGDVDGTNSNDIDDNNNTTAAPTASTPHDNSAV